MNGFYRAHGGLVTGAELVPLLRPLDDQPLSHIARRVVGREWVHIDWQSTLWVPLFQFSAPGLSLQHVVGTVIGELAGVYDDWDIAAWFARSNDWLDGEAPAVLLQHDGAAVLQAARADRYVASG